MTSSYSTTSRGGTGLEDFRERADRGRAAQGCSVLVLSAFCLALGIWSLTASQVPLGLLFSFGGAGLVLYAVGRFVLYRRLRKAGDLWRQVDGGVEFGPAPYPIWD